MVVVIVVVVILAIVVVVGVVAVVADVVAGGIADTVVADEIFAGVAVVADTIVPDPF